MSTTVIPGDTSLSRESNASPVGFTMFNAKANKKLHQEFINQQEHYREYVADLEKFIHESGLEIPEFVHEFKKKADDGGLTKGRDRRVSGLMEDGSLESLTKAVGKHDDHVHRYEIHVQYRNMTFWNMIPEKTIPTVGSVLLSMVGVGGKKRRVDIVKDLTGRILPKRMTLVMGPPGCGESSAAILIIII
jgi:hypothetical protein